MGINNNGPLWVGLLGLVLVAPSALRPKDPPVAPTMGFFLDDWQAKNFAAPDYREVSAAGGVSAAAGAGGPDVTVTIDAADIITKIPRSEFGHNANTWMTAMITEPVFMQHVHQLQPHIIRWPAGSGSDGYFWNRAPGDLPADVPAMLMDKSGKKKYGGFFWGRPRGGRSASLDDYYEMRRETGNEGLIDMALVPTRWLRLRIWRRTGCVMTMGVPVTGRSATKTLAIGNWVIASIRRKIRMVSRSS